MRYQKYLLAIFALFIAVDAYSLDMWYNTALKVGSSGTCQCKAIEGGDATWELWADEGDDADDKWGVVVDAATNAWTIKQGATSMLKIASGAPPLTTLGDTIYGGASGAATRLPGNTTTIKKFSTQTGDGANSAAPAWGTIAAGDLPAASTSAAGAVELATATETTTGTDNTRAVTPDGLAGSEIFGAKVVQIQCVADATDVDTTSGICHWFVPRAMNGMNLVRAQAMVATAGTTNATTIQVRNLTKYSSNDALSTAISIASGDTVGTAGTVNASYDDVATNDKIKVYVTAQSTTKPKGLWVVLEYMLP
jgi:hypothetical protein